MKVIFHLHCAIKNVLISDAKAVSTPLSFPTISRDKFLLPSGGRTFRSSLRISVAPSSMESFAYTVRIWFWASSTVTSPWKALLCIWLSSVSMRHWVYFCVGPWSRPLPIVINKVLYFHSRVSPVQRVTVFQVNSSIVRGSGLLWRWVVQVWRNQGDAGFAHRQIRVSLSSHQLLVILGSLANMVMTDSLVWWQMPCVCNNLYKSFCVVRMKMTQVIIAESV